MQTSDPPPLGLSSAEAAARLRAGGPNELRVARGSSVWHALVALARQPLFMLLFAAAGVYLWLGERNEALALMASAVVAAAITTAQQYRTERVLLALRELAAPRALVLRDGVPVRIAGRDVVPGDVLLLREGDRIAADATVLDADGLRVDESLLTGESAAVQKFAPAPVYANTLVLAGQARAEVRATGRRTEMGRIGETLAGLQQAASPLQRDMARLARDFGAVGAALSLVIVLVHGLVDGRWVDGVLRGLTLAMAILPEEFPLVITVFMALGARRLAQHRVLTRRPDAIEALGAATVLCVDKTGTLTHNRMALERSIAADAGEAAAADLARAAALACEPQPFDPMEQACLQWARSFGVPAAPPDGPRRRYPLREDRLAMGLAWSDGAGWTLAAKGAPEHVLRLCGEHADPQGRLAAQVQALAADGLRVLAVAAVAGEGALPDDLAGAGLRLLGLIGFRDPLREQVPAAVADCRRAGIRVLMITGDYPLTACAIARAGGLAAEPRVITGDDVDACDDAALAARLRGVDVVARARPLTKLRLVQALQRAGDVVAMTGDGVNDAPALRAAHIGVAMGARGSDVAREAAGLILLDDDFGSLVAAVRHGRRIFANLRQALLYLLSVHVPMIGLSLLPLFGGPPILMPLHVMFLEFVIDPACSLAFEAERGDDDLMARPPRPAVEHVLGPRHVRAAMLHGAIALAACGAVLALARSAALPDTAMRTNVVTTVIVMNLVLILHERSARAGWRAHLALSNGVLWALVAGTLAAWAAVLGFEPLREAFRLAPPDRTALLHTLPCIAAAVLALRAALALAPSDPAQDARRRTA